MSIPRPTPLGQRHPRLVELVVAELRRLIVAGHWPQGHRLIESRVAEELGVSRNPVREAFRSLAAEGFVELEPRRGARVALVAPHEVDQLFEVRAALDELAAGLAARRRSPEQLAALQTVVAEGTRLVGCGDLAALPPLNSRFHELLTEAAGNRQLTAIMGPLRDRIQWVYSARLHLRAESSWAEHGAIVAAVAEGDEPLARRIAGEHIAEARAVFVGSPG